MNSREEWERSLGTLAGWSGTRIEEKFMSDWQPAGYEDRGWIVADPQLLGGKLAICGTRLCVSLIPEWVAGGMSLAEIDEAFDHGFPHEALPDVLRVASELTDSFHGWWVSFRCPNSAAKWLRNCPERRLNEAAGVATLPPLSPMLSASVSGMPPLMPKEND
jgi:uncharacterized protein (DUF433 family)